jgi:hypothetical protein
MENIEIELDGTTFKINGLPDAVKVISLTKNQARRLTDMALHQHDLNLAKEALLEIGKIENFRESRVADLLWRAAVIHCVKCFTPAAARGQLSPQKILKSEPSEALDAFQYFLNLRNKHFIHDENSLAQCIPCAVINNGTKSYKIEKVVCQSIHVITLDQGTYTNLTLLVDKSLAWVVSEFDMLCDRISAELEQVPYDQLLATPQPVFTTHGDGDMGKTRK